MRSEAVSQRARKRDECHSPERAGDGSDEEKADQHESTEEVARSLSEFGREFTAS